MLYYCAVHRLIFSQNSTCQPLVAAGSEFGALLRCPGALAAGGVRGLHVSCRHDKVKLNALTDAIFIFFTIEPALKRMCYHQMFGL